MTRQRPHPRHASGFTLIEGMVASVVFLLSMAGLLGALVHARGSTGAAARKVGATAVATDMLAQMQLWSYDDPRLVSSGGACAADPADAAGVLVRTPRDVGPYTTFVACLHDEADFRNGPWLPTAEFPAPPAAPSSTFRRYFSVREVNDQNALVGVAHSGSRKLVWVIVTWSEGGQDRKVTSQFILSNPRAVASPTGGGA